MLILLYWLLLTVISSALMVFVGNVWSEASATSVLASKVAAAVIFLALSVTVLYVTLSASSSEYFMPMLEASSNRLL